MKQGDDMKFQDKKAIFFDLDGTLIDSVPDLAIAINQMLKQLGREGFKEETIRYWVGNGARVSVSRALSGSVEVDKALTPELIEEALAIFFPFYEKSLTVSTKLYPNVKETLERLHKKYRLVVVTNKPVEFVEPILKGFGIDELFEFYIGGNSLEKKKPDPMPLLYVCEKLNISVDEAVMVGDTQNDILSANRANMQSIGLTYGYNYGQPISSFNPDLVVDDFSDILKSFL